VAVVFTCSVPLGAPSLGLVAERSCLGLAEAGLLDAIVAPGFGGGGGWAGARRVRVPVRTIPLLGRTGWGRSYQLLLRDVLFDRLAAARTGGRSSLMSISGMCRSSLRRAAAGGCPTWLICPSTHVDAQHALVSRARAAIGLPARPSELNGWLARRARDEYGRAAVLVVQSELARATFVEHGVPGERLVTLRPGVDLDRFAPSEPPADAVLRVLFVGQLGVRKGLHTLLDACARLEPSTYALTLVGGMEPEAAWLLTRRPHVNVRRLPFTPAVPAQMAASHVLVLPSVEDGFGLVALEAMASARPVIVSDACGVKEVVPDGGGEVVPASDAAALSAALGRLADCPRRRREMGREARRAAEGLSWAVWQRGIARLVQARP
jgi:glycosyltransferase involved in cell wall biosynthesis